VIRYRTTPPHHLHGKSASCSKCEDAINRCGELISATSSNLRFHCVHGASDDSSPDENDVVDVLETVKNAALAFVADPERRAEKYERESEEWTRFLAMTTLDPKQDIDELRRANRNA
jgi:hypothetical protein